MFPVPSAAPDFWIVANFKETQLKTGSRFSLLPPENATATT
jgi:hypothetical protein